MAIDALLQVLAVGSGASLGREQAPRLFAAAATELTIRSGSIPAPYRRILLASAAGAGLARFTTFRRPAPYTLRHRAEKLAARRGAGRGRDLVHRNDDRMAGQPR